LTNPENSKQKKNNIFLFSIDLEDVRDQVENGLSYKERVPKMIEKYLNFLNKYKFKCTFFTVGITAERYPSLIKMLYDEGHEIACHTYFHEAIKEYSKVSFKDDLNRNIDVILKTGVNNIYGFRAPSYSMTENTQWAYEVLEELKFQYSSSVMPANNPLYGWKGFGTEIRKIGNIYEIPITITSNKFLNIPFGGGIYFRVLPFFYINRKFKMNFNKNKPVIGYFHPYDIDTEQERFIHPGINQNKLYHYMMFRNRKKVLAYLEKLKINFNYNIISYRNYIKSL
jgi:polysaccharide deacetylase family protein (PEP-CTERM system associated)